VGGSVPVPGEVLDRILGPLLENAFRYAVDGIGITARRTDHAVLISIRNDGPPVTQAEHLFEPGVRDPGSPGAGLGLALARRLARAAGGDVRLESPQPATFRVELPVEQGSARADGPPAP
jgi:signal transduction histidine kinase